MHATSVCLQDMLDRSFFITSVAIPICESSGQLKLEATSISICQLAIGGKQASQVLVPKYTADRENPADFAIFSLLPTLRGF